MHHGALILPSCTHPPPSPILSTHSITIFIPILTHSHVVSIQLAPFLSDHFLFFLSLCFSGHDQYGLLSPHNYLPSHITVKILVESLQQEIPGGAYGSLGGVRGYHIIWGDPAPLPYGTRVTEEMLDAQCVFSDNAGRMIALVIPSTDDPLVSPPPHPQHKHLIHYSSLNIDIFVPNMCIFEPCRGFMWSYAILRSRPICCLQ